jgi:hypothetical protein
MKGGRDGLLRAGLLATSARFDRERDRGRSLQGAAELDIDELRGATGKMKLALWTAAYDPASAGRMIRLSLTARTPGVTSAATRTAFLSTGESTIPQSSTVPSCTMTLISDGRLHGSALSRSTMPSRILASSGAPPSIWLRKLPVLATNSLDSRCQ